MVLRASVHDYISLNWNYVNRNNPIRSFDLSAGFYIRHKGKHAALFQYL